MKSYHERPECIFSECVASIRSITYEVISGFYNIFKDADHYDDPKLLREATLGLFTIMPTIEAFQKVIERNVGHKPDDKAYNQMLEVYNEMLTPEWKDSPENNFPTLHKKYRFCGKDIIKDLIELNHFNPRIDRLIKAMTDLETFYNKMLSMLQDKHEYLKFSHSEKQFYGAMYKALLALYVKVCVDKITALKDEILSLFIDGHVAKAFLQVSNQLANDDITQDEAIKFFKEILSQPEEEASNKENVH